MLSCSTIITSKFHLGSGDKTAASQLQCVRSRRSSQRWERSTQCCSFLSPNKITKVESPSDPLLTKYSAVTLHALHNDYAFKSEDDNSTSFHLHRHCHVPSAAAAPADLNNFIELLYRFSRPHTIIGTLLGITSVSLLPVQTLADFTPAFFLGLLKALVPSVLMNVYVVGLNQLYDVEIDKVNKPDLPLASGGFSMETGAAIVSICLVTSLGMGMMFQSPPLLLALFVSFLLGSGYSIELPFLRWKRHPFLAATCILIVRAVIVQLAFFIHIQKCVLGRPVVITRSLVFATAFMCFFSSVIALFKDLPDVDGDRHFGIQSFSVTLGQQRVFWLCISMLMFAYGASVVVGAYSSDILSKLITILGHCTLASLLWLQAQSVDLSSKASITSFYMFIWKLFYAEYLLIPFVR